MYNVVQARSTRVQSGVGDARSAVAAGLPLMATSQKTFNLAWKINFSFLSAIFFSHRIARQHTKLDPFLFLFSLSSSFPIDIFVPFLPSPLENLI